MARWAGKMALTYGKTTGANCVAPAMGKPSNDYTIALFTRQKVNRISRHNHVSALVAQLGIRLCEQVLCGTTRFERGDDSHCSRCAPRSRWLIVAEAEHICHPWSRRAVRTALGSPATLNLPLAAPGAIAGWHRGTHGTEEFADAIAPLTALLKALEVAPRVEPPRLEGGRRVRANECPRSATEKVLVASDATSAEKRIPFAVILGLRPLPRGCDFETVPQLPSPRGALHNIVRASHLPACGALRVAKADRIGALRVAPLRPGLSRGGICALERAD